MSLPTCSACGAEKSPGSVRQCNKCHRILCDSCKGPLSACKNSKRGKSECNGIFLRPQWR
jgi:hypothetical protein